MRLTEDWGFPHLKTSGLPLEAQQCLYSLVQATPTTYRCSKDITSSERLVLIQNQSQIWTSADRHGSRSSAESQLTRRKSRNMVARVTFNLCLVHLMTMFVFIQLSWRQSVCYCSDIIVGPLTHTLMVKSIKLVSNLIVLFFTRTINLKPCIVRFKHYL